ncbi:hypothetical protein KIW84_035754, partial [Lathyrus oleraceus]
LGVSVETNLTSPLILQPDITRQFTNNLKNIADIMSVPQEPTTHPPATQNVSSASVPFTSDRAEQKSVVPLPQNLKDGVESAPEICASDSSRPQNTWADVEHLFEGYDEKQKAAIQRERTRRLEEQNKMFAARKLCLVLDLDHTLLNSAKFMEVDPVHDEILRKKEEQDREKPHRHLFRFPHMGMWTKLRPGVWNFLEKVFCSMEYLQKEENKDKLLRLLSFLKNEYAHLFTPEQNKEIQVMITSIVSVDALGNSEVIGRAGKLEAFDRTQQLLGLEATGLISSSMLVHDNSANASEALIYGQNNIKGRGVMLPLFDLHKDHDLDSLPSPTREAPSCFPVNRLLSVGDGMDRFGFDFRHCI